MKEILVLRSGGMPLFSFSASGAPKLDTLVAGFLSAQAGFAQEIGEGTIQVVTFAENKFIYESRSDLLFIIVIAQDEDEHIYRVMLKEIAHNFVQKYQDKLSFKIVSSDLFIDFHENLMQILTKYDRKPHIQPRFPIAILAPEVSDQIAQLVHQVQGSSGILRVAIFTTDGHVVVSHLDPSELQFALSQIQKRQQQDLPTFFSVAQTILDERLRLFFHLITNDLLLGAIVREEQTDAQITETIAPMIQLMATLNYSSMVKVQPYTRISDVYSDHEVLISNHMLESTLYAEHTPAAREFRDLFGDAGTRVLGAIDGVATVAEIRARTDIRGRQLTEILNYLVSKGFSRKVQFYPKLAASDARFLAYLETVGLPRDEYKILEQARHYCDGQNSIRDISLRIGVEHEKLVKILRKLGDHVEWLT